MILKILFIVLAAICKAFSNTIAFHNGGMFHEHKFFDINKQGKFLPFTKYPVDGFHIFNSLMIIFFMIAIFGFTWKVIVAGIVFNLTFNYFFNKLLN